jgi:virginiamycin B lyase
MPAHETTVREIIMQLKAPLASISLVGALGWLTVISAPAQIPAALSGQVSSVEEGAMEGVLVSARKDGATVTTTVVTGDKGQYTFPADRLEPGHYAITIRAIGYDLNGPAAVDVPGGGSKADIKLVKTRNLANQLTNAEWLISAPGSDAIKTNLAQCVNCHSLQRIFASTHDPVEFLQVFKRMSTYAPGTTPLHAQLLLPGPRGERQRMAESQTNTVASWLASVNMSNSDARTYELKTLPRPTGRATKVIITEYDLPRKLAQPHDVTVDQDGLVWYSDFSNQFAGVLDPKTGKAIDIPIPEMKPDEPKGSLQIELEAGQKYLWVAMMYQAGLARIDRKTREVAMFPFPKEWQSSNAQASMVAPQHSDVDGKVWTNNQEAHDMYRLDVKTGEYENLGPSRDPGGRQIPAYGIPTDQQNNVYQLEFGGTSIGFRDARTGMTTIYRTPTSGSRPRRGRVDGQNRLWFAESGGNAIGLFDPKTAAIREYPLPARFYNPYDVVPNREITQVWTGSMMNDRVARLDTSTGEFTEYLLPRPTNIRHVALQETGLRPALWVGSNHGASIVRVEPLD